MINLTLLDDMLALDSQIREQALRAIGDSIEYNHWDPMDLKDLVEELMERIAEEPEASLREVLYRNLSKALLRGPIDTYWHPLVEYIQHPQITVPDLSSILQILGYTRQSEFKELIQSYLDHPQERVRIVAQEALQALN